jgi:hypothetical protein
MDEPVRYFTVDGAGTTFVHPVGLCMLLLCGILLVSLPRRFALWPFIVLVCFVSSRQCIAIAGVNLYFARFMVLVFGTARVLIHREVWTVRWNRLDLFVVCYGLVYLVAGAINWDFSPVELKTRSGYIVEVVGTYLLCRVLIRDREDVRSVFACLSLVACILVGFFVLENRTGRNLFSVFGGVPEITAQREGRLRCQGAFGHPILAGVFWASMVPTMFFVVLAGGRLRPLALVGTLSAIAMVVLSASSTPVLALGAGFAGWMFFPFRRHTRRLFWGVLVLLFCLHMLMNGPVWSLIQRIDITAGNSAYHRYVLLDGFITHFHEWAALGSRVGTAHWGRFTFDTANQFVAVGSASGLLTLLIFIGMIVAAMNRAGRIANVDAGLGWSVGVTIFALMVSFLGISVWGQAHFAWSLPLAIAASLSGNPQTAAKSVLSEQKRVRYVRGPRAAAVAASI